MDIRHRPLKLAWQYLPDRNDNTPMGVNASTTMQGPVATYRNDRAFFQIPPHHWLCQTFDDQMFLLDELAGSILLRPEASDAQREAEKALRSDTP